jgi:hypothetical protein
LNNKFQLADTTVKTANKQLHVNPVITKNKNGKKWFNFVPLNSYNQLIL